MERVKGTIERVTYHDPTSGFCVLKVLPQGESEAVAVVGRLTIVTQGEEIEAVGRWTQDKVHGRQFQADRIIARMPTSAAGLERYLGSGAIQGIGPQLAAKIVAFFGERTFDVLENQPSRLTDVRGVGAKTLARIKQSWQEGRHVRELTFFLQEHGIGAQRALRIYRTYGEKAIELIRANPYRLTQDVRGVGFKTADGLARELGIPADSPFRIRAAARHVLKELSEEGHTGFAESAVVARAKELLGIAEGLIERAIADEVADGFVVREPMAEGDQLFLAPLYRAESGIAHHLARLARANPHPLAGKNAGALLEELSAGRSLQLSAGQKAAVAAACQRCVLVVTGGPGVGKTTVVRSILDVFQAAGCKAVLAAPTGRAAKRLAEATGRPAQTLHRLLAFDPAAGEFKHDASAPLEGDLFVLDETSMIDVTLAFQFLRAAPTGAALVLVGDVDQLPSVGPGAFLGDALASGVVPAVRLEEVFRQANESRIIEAASAVHQGRLPESPPEGELSDFYFLEADEPEAIRNLVVRLVRDRIPARFGLDPRSDIQVLTPMVKGELGAAALNELLRDVLNPAKGQAEIARYGSVFRVGDRVLQTENDYTREVFNGDLGVVEAIDAMEQSMVVRFEGRPVEYDFGDLDKLALSYAMTIHKSQGSEYPAVVLVLHTQHYVMLERNLVYTGITRGRKLVVVAGSRRAFARAASRRPTTVRVTSLRRRLAEAFGNQRFP